jgi:hypothetical protein
VAKYGVDYIMVSFVRCASEMEAFEKERRLIAECREQGIRLVNRTEGGEGTAGFKQSAEARAKMSAWRKGRKEPPEFGAKIRARQLGKKVSPKQLAAIREFHERPEVRAKISAGNKGKKVSAEARAKIAAFQRGRTRSPETRARMSAAQKGKKRSPEARARISASKRGKKFSPEQRAALSVAMKRAFAAHSEYGRKMSASRRGKERPASIIAKILETKRLRRAQKATQPTPPIAKP